MELEELPQGLVGLVRVGDRVSRVFRLEHAGEASQPIRGYLEAERRPRGIEGSERVPGRDEGRVPESTVAEDAVQRRRVHDATQLLPCLAVPSRGQVDLP